MRCEELCPECEESCPPISAWWGVVLGIVVGILVVLLAGLI